jgi:polysaccharide chain length determinant protein (PEP-CTERM system associated)
MDRLDDLIRQGLLILRGMWQWRWLGLIVAWLVVAIATVMIIRMPNQYEASARIYVDTQSVLNPLMSGLAVQPNIDWQLQMLSRTLISRPNMEQLIRMADLDHTVQTREQRDALVEGLMRTLRISGTGSDNLYTLSYRATDPARAHRVVQSLTSMFVEMSLGDKRKDADAARKFIEEQIKVYEAKLDEAENRLKAFRLRNLGLQLGVGGDAFARVAEADSALGQARLALREAENSRDALKRQIDGEEPVFLGGAFSESPGMALVASNTELDQRIDGLQRALDALLLRYTDQHPDVAGTRRLIRDLEDQRRAAVAEAKAKAAAAAAARPAAAAPPNVAQNPVYQHLKLSLADAEANIASLRTRVAEYENRYNRVKSMLVMRPEIEIEYTQLNRDYHIHKENYETLVSRREQAIISSQMEASAAMADFRLVEPPRVSPEPVAPNRTRLFNLAFIGALGAGLFAALAASRVRPTFFDPRSLREATGVPVLGRVSLLPSVSMLRRERLATVAFLVGAAALVGSYGLGTMFISAYSNGLL